MASINKTYLNLVLFLVLLVEIKCYVIKINDEKDTSNIEIKLYNKKDNDDCKSNVTNTEARKETQDKDVTEKSFNGLDKRKLAQIIEIFSNYLKKTSNDLPDNFYEGEDTTMLPKETAVIPSFNNRVGVVVGSCPLGYVRTGPFCIKAERNV